MRCSTFDCQCQPCSNCTSNQFLVSPCNDTHNTVCSNCTRCTPGQYVETECNYNGPGLCSCCRPGTYTVEGSEHECLLCRPGTYSDGSCASSCRPCQAGFYQPEWGMTNCTPCERGKYQLYPNNCTYCSAGTYQNKTGQTNCTGCQAGKYSTGLGIENFENCTCCSENQYQTATGQSSCDNCKLGSYSFDTCCANGLCCLSCQTWILNCSAPDQQCGSSAFIYESSWTAASRQVGMCPSCTAGKYFLFDPVNKQLPAQGSSVYPELNFSRISIPNSGSWHFHDVTKQSTTKVDASLAVLHEMGLGFVNFIQNKEAHIGVQYTVSSTGPSSLLLQLKTFVGDGEFRNELQSPIVRFGVYGMNTTSASLRVFKADGLFGYVNGADLSAQETDAEVLFQHLGGNFTGNDSGIILYFASTPSIKMLIESSVGSEDPLPSNPCLLSIDGDLSVIKEADFEKPAPMNPTLMCVTCRCAGCSPGKYSTKMGSMTEYDCLLCDPGKYSAEQNSTACLNCPAGTYSQYFGGTGFDSCVRCDISSYAPAQAGGATACTSCDTGKFTGFLGGKHASDCAITCADGQFLSGNKSCVSCEPGTFSLAGQMCHDCSPGTYSSQSGASICLQCAPETYAFYIGATACITIQILIEQFSTSLICPNCTNMGAYYLRCPNGTYATDLAATVCSNCSAGTFASSIGSSSCNLCIPGQYSQSGASRCVNCAPGTYSVRSGSSSTKDCVSSTTGKITTALLQTTAALGVSAPATASFVSAITNISCTYGGPEQVGNYICSGGKSVLNYFCAAYRDDHGSWSIQKQMKFLAKCMSQDCQQSLSSNSQSYSNFCRFLDTNGFCYSYKEAQIWCSQNSGDAFCISGGLQWAVSPVGAATSVNETQWTPNSQCSCLKNCACSTSMCWCSSNQDRHPIGQSSPSGLDYERLSNSVFGSNQASKKGMCACSCGGVLGI